MCPVGPPENTSQVFRWVTGGCGKWEVTGRPLGKGEGEPWMHSMGLSAAIRANRLDKSNRKGF